MFVARRAQTYAVSLDTLGRLRWTSPDVRGDQLVCIVSERAPADYVDGLRQKEISHIVTGADGIDLADAMAKLAAAWAAFTARRSHTNRRFCAVSTRTRRLRRCKVAKGLTLPPLLPRTQSRQFAPHVSCG